LWVWDDSEPQRVNAIQAGWNVGIPDFSVWKGRIIVSPGIPWEHPILATARCAGIPITSDIQFFFDIFPGFKAIGITGSNGKTTTCSLIKHGLQAMGYDVVLAGNIGQPIFNTPPVAEPSGAGKDVIYVLELSSYQLEYSQALPLTAALVLNLVPHHLERHGTMETYASIKRSILNHATYGWLPACWPWAGPQDQGNNPVSHRFWSDDIVQSWSLSPFLQTPHNRSNTAAAMHVLSCFGTLPLDVWTHVTGIEHRQELFGSYKGIAFINDSKATNPHSVAAALNHCCGQYDHVIWIGGGVSQQDDLRVLAPCVARIGGAIFMGQSAQRYAAWFKAHQGPSSVTVSSIKQAVEQAVALAHAWQRQASLQDPESSTSHVCIVLSPGCASQDMFRHFEHRGRVFKDTVHNLFSATTVLESADE